MGPHRPRVECSGRATAVFRARNRRVPGRACGRRNTRCRRSRSRTQEFLTRGMVCSNRVRFRVRLLPRCGEVQVEVVKAQHALDRVGRRGQAARRNRIAWCQRTSSATRRNDVIDAGIPADARDRDRSSQARSAGKKMHRRRADSSATPAASNASGAAPPIHRHPPAAQLAEIDPIGGMGVQMPRHCLTHHRRYVRPSIAGNAVGEDDLARGLDRCAVLLFDVQAEMPGRRSMPTRQGAVAHRDVEKSPMPGEIFHPGRAGDALKGGIGVAAIAGLVPSLKA